MPIPAFLAELRRHVGHALILVPTTVVIVRDNDARILFVHDDDADAWTLPGGILEPDEAPSEAAVREVREETGIEICLTVLVDVIGGAGCETTYRNGDRIAWVATLYAARVTGGKLLADGHEIREARFVAPADIPGFGLRADAQRFLDAEREKLAQIKLPCCA